MSEEQANIAQHTLALLRRMDAKLDGMLVRLSVLERIGRRSDIPDSPSPPAA